MFGKINNYSKYFWLFLTLIFCSPIGHANWNFSGNLVLPPVCLLSSTNNILVSFGKVGVEKVDGVFNEQPIAYELICATDIGNAWDVKLKFSGITAGTGFDNATLATVAPLNSYNLGIQIKKDGIPQPLNTAFTINPDAPPKLSAVLVKKANTTLQAEDFKSSGTLTIEFQ